MPSVAFRAYRWICVYPIQGMPQRAFPTDFMIFILEFRPMALEKEWLDRAAAISTAILQLRDSL